MSDQDKLEAISTLEMYDMVKSGVTLALFASWVHHVTLQSYMKGHEVGQKEGWSEGYDDGYAEGYEHCEYGSWNDRD